ncbi:MAG: hypothetical protein KatS3mg008_1566 [Acidimicrobiales bacterium]|nr:MAG: hypothetical protein KatS3mg008_1566 [Acidimicrobiales bacterium]
MPEGTPRRPARRMPFGCYVIRFAANFQAGLPSDQPSLIGVSVP